MKNNQILILMILSINYKIYFKKKEIIKIRKKMNFLIIEEKQ